MRASRLPASHCGWVPRRADSARATTFGVRHAGCEAAEAMTGKKAIDVFLNPASVAIVGASDRPTSSGGAVLRNLRRSGYPGRIVPINPKGGEIDGLKVAVSLRKLRTPVDLVAVLVRSESILEVVAEAADSGHKNILILPGGFAEA